MFLLNFLPSHNNTQPKRIYSQLKLIRHRNFLLLRIHSFNNHSQLVRQRMKNIFLLNRIFLDTSNFFSMPPSSQPNPFMVLFLVNEERFFDISLLEYRSTTATTTTTGSSTISQSIWQTTCKFNKSLSLILTYSNKTS